MHWIVIVVMVANIFSVAFASKGSKLAWAFSLVGGLLMCWMLLKDRLFMTFAFNAYGVGAAVVGLITWKTREDTKRTICFSRTWIVALVVAILAGGIYMLDKEINAKLPVFDSLGTALTTVATFLMVKKDINAWICFLTADAMYVAMGIISGSILSGNGYTWILIYGAMCITASYGLYNFLKIYRHNRSVEKSE